jgi:hypothetical protein
VFALADGTTQSFNSDVWATIITNEFVRTPFFSPNELTNLFKKEVEQYQKSEFQFSASLAKASLERAKKNKGGTATFIGIRFENENNVTLISCGDSNFFKVGSDNRITSYPYSDLNSLDANNNFINTEALLQNEIHETFYYVKNIDYEFGDKLILATDALSRLIINKPEMIYELFKISDFKQFKDFCISLWNRKELQEDDITAIIINVDRRNSIKVITPPDDFIFPREKEEDFIPTSIQQEDTIVQLTDMKIHEIRNQFDGVTEEIRRIKIKQTLHQILIMIGISLTLFNLIYTVIFRNRSPEIKTDRENKMILKLSDKDEIIRSQQSEINLLRNKFDAIDTTHTKK